MGLIGILAASILNIFLASDGLSWIISIVGVVIFTALTAYDVQRIQNGELAIQTGLDGEGGRHRRAPPLPGLREPVPVHAAAVRRPRLTVAATGSRRAVRPRGEAR